MPAKLKPSPRRGRPVRRDPQQLELLSLDNVPAPPPSKSDAPLPRRPKTAPPSRPPARSGDVAAELISFREFGEATRILRTSYASAEGRSIEVDTYVNEFWTAKQRDAHSLHEISYRACFKPQLPRFFIERFTQPGDVVYDPFMGRGTTPLEAALMGRIPMACDINPLSVVLTQPRLRPVTLAEIERRFEKIDWTVAPELPEDLLVFYHPDTLREIGALRHYLIERDRNQRLDAVDAWIRMVALNRLTGHSVGFFSVYTLPPNQATSVTAQRKINARRQKVPPRRDVRQIILKKSRSLLADCTPAQLDQLKIAAQSAQLITAPAARTPQLLSEAVSLVVTSPPFLDVVNYAGDNWLRCWFLGIDAKQIAITQAGKVEKWQAEMTQVFHELARVLRPGGHVAFEVGEVRHGRIKLEDYVLPAGEAAGLKPLWILINDQTFTKTANCWGVDNQEKGTNTNRIVVFRKP